jgi:DNA-directed RNA polymerase III subunit RPC2
MKKQKFYVKTSGFKDLPLFILFKALGVANEQLIIQLIGADMAEKLIMSFEDVEEHQIYTQEKAFTFIGQNIKVFSEEEANRSKVPLAERARQKLERMNPILKSLLVVFLSHVSCRKFDFFPRALYLALMVHRLVSAMGNSAFVDNRMKCAG